MLLSLLTLCLLLANSAAKKQESSFALFNVYMHGQLQHEGLCANFQQFYWKSLPRDPTSEETVKFHYYLNWWREDKGDLDVCNGTDSDLGGEIIPLRYVTSDQPEGLSRCEQLSGKHYVERQMKALEQAGAPAALFLLEKGKKSDFHEVNLLHSRFFNPKVGNKTMTFYIYDEQFSRFSDLVDVQKNHGPALSFYRPADPFFDGGVLCLLALAVGCIALGCIWYVYELHKAVHEFRRLRGTDGLAKFLERHGISGLPRGDHTLAPAAGEQSQAGGHSSQPLDGAEAQSRANSPSSGSTAELTTEPKTPSRTENCVAAVFVTAVMLSVVVGVLLLSFFYRSMAVTAFNVMMVVAGTSATTACVLALTRVCVQDPQLPSIGSWFGLEGWADKWFVPHFVSRPFRPFGLMVLLGALAFALTWYMCMDDPRSIYMLDVMNAFLCIYAVRKAEIKSLCFVTCFLVAMFFYDIVMVFGTRLLTKNGCSVMVQVVTGMDCFDVRPTNYTSDWTYPGHVKWADQPRRIPILFYMPVLTNPVGRCLDPAVEGDPQLMMLGLGDVIAPGYLIAFAFYLDFAQRRRLYPYGLTALLGYTVGMLATFTSLKLMDTAQPALIYLVPFTLCPLVLLCLYHGTLKLAWFGHFGNVFDR